MRYFESFMASNDGIPEYFNWKCSLSWIERSLQAVRGCLVTSQVIQGLIMQRLVMYRL